MAQSVHILPVQREVRLLDVSFIVGEVELVPCHWNSQEGSRAGELELDRAHIVEVFFLGPLPSLLTEELEQLPLKIHKRFGDHRDILPLPRLDVHHCHQRVPSCQPLLRGFVETSNTTHHPSVPCLDDGSGIDPKRVTVVAIEVGGEGTATLVSEVVGDRFEGALEFFV